MRRNEEHHLQVSLIKWFDAQYPKLRLNLFAVPNGSNIGQRAGAYMRAEGLRSGVSDLIFCYNGVATFIEVKTPKGRQNENQKKFEKAIKKAGFEYFIVRSVDEFIEIIKYQIAIESLDGVSLSRPFKNKINRT